MQQVTADIRISCFTYSQLLCAELLQQITDLRWAVTHFDMQMCACRCSESQSSGRHSSFENAHNGCVENMAEPFLKKTLLFQIRMSYLASQQGAQISDWTERSVSVTQREHKETHSECFAKTKNKKQDTLKTYLNKYGSNFLKLVGVLFLFVCDRFYMTL